MKNILETTKIKTKLIALLLSLIAFAGLTISIIFIRHFDLPPIYRPLRMTGRFW